MIRRSLAATGIALSVVLGTATAAEARPVPDTPIECGPYVQVGMRCVEPVRQHHDTAGQWFLAALGTAFLLVLL